MDLHNMIKSVFFPESLEKELRFKLKEADYDYIREYMGMYPRESKEPSYPDLADWDNYVKFLGFGGAKAIIPNHIRVHNKVGLAYGYLTDAAYIVDNKRQKEFLLAATIYVNKNETFNDDNYEYDSIGFEFLRRLGQGFLQME